MRGETVIVKCKRYGDLFTARVADRKRGWGKFCSKSCKAINQTHRTGYAGPRDDDEPRQMSGGDLNEHGQW